MTSSIQARSMAGIVMQERSPGRFHGCGPILKASNVRGQLTSNPLALNTAIALDEVKN
jgi:hypothetical protein